MEQAIKLDILAFGAHPDDVELGAGGTLARQAALGYKTGIIDLTCGELGTRGTPELRLQEATKAAEILGVSVREQMHFRDGFLTVEEALLLPLIQKIRLYRPEIVIANAVSDRHPDHGTAAALVAKAVFLSGLRKIETLHNGELQQAWRPRQVYHYIQFFPLEPQVLVDISDYMDAKMQSIQAYASQFYNPDSREPVTPIATKGFMESLHGRAADLGKNIGVAYAEGFTTVRPPGVQDLMGLF